MIQKCPICDWEIKETRVRVKVGEREITVCSDDCAQISLSVRRLGPHKPYVIACLGASITAAKGSFNWIQELQNRPHNADFRFVNLGVGGDLAYNALQRVPKVIACQPQKILVLIGHNDILALVFKQVRNTLKWWKKLPFDPSPEWYRENLVAIVNQLKSKTTAQIALISLSPVGEELESTNLVQHELNSLVRQYNRIIQDVAQKEGVAYIPFYEHFCKEMHAEVNGKAFCDFSFFSFYRDAFRHFFLHQSFERIAHVNGWAFHTDGIHLNRRSGMLLVDLVQAFLENLQH